MVKHEEKSVDRAFDKYVTENQIIWMRNKSFDPVK